MWQEFSNYLCSKPAKEQELTWNKRVAVFSSEKKKKNKGQPIWMVYEYTVQAKNWSQHSMHQEIEGERQKKYREDEKKKHRTVYIVTWNDTYDGH